MFVGSGFGDAIRGASFLGLEVGTISIFRISLLLDGSAGSLLSGIRGGIGFGGFSESFWYSCIKISALDLPFSLLLA